MAHDTARRGFVPRWIRHVVASGESRPLGVSRDRKRSRSYHPLAWGKICVTPVLRLGGVHGAPVVAAVFVVPHGYAPAVA